MQIWLKWFICCLGCELVGPRSYVLNRGLNPSRKGKLLRTYRNKLGDWYTQKWQLISILVLVISTTVLFLPVCKHQYCGYMWHVEVFCLTDSWRAALTRGSQLTIWAILIQLSPPTVHTHGMAYPKTEHFSKFWRKKLTCSVMLLVVFPNF